MTDAAHTITTYCHDVVNGTIPAGALHRAACQRHLDDLSRVGDPTFPYVFDGTKVDRLVAFARLLRHFEGEFAGQPFHLEPWQVFITGSVVGWVHRSTGLRRYRSVFCLVPRKNGKSSLCAVLVNFMFLADGEAGAQIFTAATKKDQSRIVYDAAKRMAQASGLGTRIAIQRSRMWDDRTASRVEPLASEHDSLDGLSPSFVVLDEAAQLKDRGLIDVLETALGARRQPVMWWISTAGDNALGPCGDQYRYVENILQGTITDDTTFGFVAHADPDDDWSLESTWRKANPNYGISVKPEDMHALAAKALQMPSARAAFETKRLNRWVTASTPWLNIDAWHRSQTIWSDDFRSELENRPCYVGCDLSSKNDLSAVIRLVPPTDTDDKWYAICTFWTPENGLKERGLTSRAPYETWVEHGYLNICPGDRIDNRAIDAYIRSIPHVIQAGFDTWNASELINDLLTHYDREDSVLDIKQGFGLSEACKEFEVLIAGGQFDAGSHPVMAWCVSNAVIERNAEDRIKVTKSKSRGKIDGVVAACTALKLHLIGEPEPDSLLDLMAKGEIPEMSLYV